MSTNPINQAYVYRFRDSIALNLKGPNGTVYLTPRMAKKLASLLNSGVRDIQKHSFTESELTGVYIDQEGARIKI